MGLDVFAARAPGEKLSRWDRWTFKRTKIELAGGMYSGDEGSFRGKLYTYLVQDITGVSLYQDWIPPETVWRMSEAFERCDPETVIRSYDGPYADERTADDVLQLRAFFRVCAKRRLGLVGWW